MADIMVSPAVGGDAVCQRPAQRRTVLLCGTAVFVVALLVRAGFVLRSGAGDIDKLEPVRIALSLVRNGAYADAYGDNVGPTAHCMPLHPWILAAVIRGFGPGPLGAVAVSLVASSAAALAYALLPALAAACGFGAFTGLLVGLAGALFPVNFWAQTSGTFDAPFTALGLVFLSLLLARCQTFTTQKGILVGTAAGIVCLLNIVVVQVLLGWLVLGWFQFRARWSAWLRFYAPLTLMTAAVLTPWAVRNYLAFGHLIWTRSNFGLELQVSNNAYATADLERNVRTRIWNTLHPFADDQERQKVRSMGEIAYQAAKQKQALEWIRDHPAAFARLTAQRIALFWFPRMQRRWQSALEALLTIAGLCGMAALIRRRHPYAWLFAGILLTYPIVYYFIQVSPRYRFPVEALLLLLGASLIQQMARNAAFRRRASAHNKRPGSGELRMPNATGGCLTSLLQVC